MRRQRDILLKPIIRYLPRWITPNQISVLRFLSVIPLLWFLWKEYFVLSGLIFTLAMLLDSIDGPLARLRSQTSVWGKILDPLADKIIIIPTFIIASYKFLPLELFLAILLLETIIVLTTYTIPAFRYMVERHETVYYESSWAKYKTTLYTVALILILVWPMVTITQALALYLFILGCIASCGSWLQYLQFTSR